LCAGSGHKRCRSKQQGHFIEFFHGSPLEKYSS
jgi:hypothetical protein